MAKKQKFINGRFEEPEQPGASIFWWGFLTVILLETVVLAIPCGYMFVKKIFRRSLAKRFNRFARIIGFRESITIRELAKAAQMSVENVTRDLHRMLDLGWFGDSAFLNHGEGTLIVPMNAKERGGWAEALKELFKQLKTENAQAAPETAQSVKQEGRRTVQSVKQEAPRTAQSVKQEAPQAQAKKEPRGRYIDEMERTLNELYVLNEKIEDEAVSKRIDRIGTLTEGIFRVVIDNPLRENDVRKFMNYYLPTTLRMLKAYDLLEDDHVQSASIVESRRKIEGVLDKLIQAFEQLLEKLHSTDALNLDTDIEVLETMMASDGLTEKGRMQMPSH